jgi:hypothetical protein
VRLRLSDREINRRERRRFDGSSILDGKPERHPAGEAALQRMHPGDPMTFELKRHPGARGLVRSRAVDDHVASPKFRFVLIDVLRFQPAAAGNRVGLSRDIERRAQINNGDVLAGVEAPLERFR